MRNFNFNWMKNAAKNTQTTGGGTSRRCEDANQSRIASDPIPCRYRVDTVSVDLCSPHVFPFRSQKSIGFSTLPCFGYTPGISGRLMKYAAMLTLLLTLACGQMWGTDYTFALSSFTESPTGTYTNETLNEFKCKNYGYLYVEVPSSSAAGTVSWKAHSSSAGRTLYIYKTNGTIQDDTRGMAYASGYQSVSFSSSDIYTSGGKYYLVFSSGSDDWKADGIKYVLAASGKNIYLKPNGIWDKDGARFAAYYWKSSGSGNGWVDFASYNACTPCFKATIPSGYDKVILCRINGATAVNNWDNSWNQTLDQTVPTGNDTCFTISSINGCTDGKSCGSWGTYTAPTYTISYAANSGSGSMSSQTGIACGTDKATTANAFTRDGYSFTGWHADVDVTVGGANKTAGTLLADGVTIQDISSNITLTAQWEEEVTYTVTYNANGATGSVPTDATAYAEGASVTVLGKNTLSKAGSMFVGWRTGASSGTWYVEGNTFEMGGDDVTLYAQWRTLSCPSSGTMYSLTMGNVTTTEKVTHGTEVTIEKHATIVNGTATLKNKHGSSDDKAQFSKANPGLIYLNGADAQLKLELGCALAEGDSIIVTSSDTTHMSFTRTDSRSTTPATVTHARGKVYVIPAESPLIGCTTLYCWRRADKSLRVTKLIITRPVSCSTPAAPTDFTAGSISATGATFTITDAADAASYDIYYSTSSTAPIASTPATTTSTSKTKAVTGLTAATTYYAWVRSVCDASHKSAWVALNPDDDTHTFATSCVAPTTVTISATVNEDDGYWFYPGDAIELTATPTGSPAGSPVTYQWANGGVDIVGANSSTYSVASATTADAGKYTCTISYGACSTTSAEFELKCMQFYLKNSGGSDISNHALQKVDATHATLALSLTGGTTYKFRVTDGCGNWYGNDGEMTSSNCTDWTMKDDADCRITTSSKSATYTFNFDFTGGLLGKEMEVSVVYPAGNQAVGKVIYWDNSVLNWASAPWYRIGKSTHNNKTQMTLVPGTANLYAVTTTEYNGFEYWHIANNQGQGTGNIFWTKDNSEGSPDEITNAMGFEGSPVTADAVTFTPTSSHATGSSSDNDNCEFYEYGQQNGMKTDRVTISPYSNGTITVNYTDTEDEDQSFTSGYQDLAHTVILTSITAVPASGYEIDDALTINGDDYEANYVVTGATTVAASFKPATYTVTLNTNSGIINAGNVTSYTYLTGATLPTNVTRDGYRFMGWYATSNFSTDRVYTIGTSEYGNKEYWAKWAQLYTITNGSPANGTITVASSAIEGETVSISAAANTGYVFDEWNVYKTGTPATKVSTAAATASTNFTMPAYDVTVDASFVVQTYTLSYSIGTGATGAASGGTAAGSYAEGTTITVPAQGTLANTGYTFRGWTDGTTFYKVGQTFTMPTSNVTVSAVWDEPVSDCKTWSGSPNSFTDGSMTVSTNLILTSGSISNPSSQDIYSGTKATCFVIDGSSKYLEGHLYDGGDISSVTISAATNQSSTYKYAIVFSTSSDFSATVTPDSCEAPSASATRDDSKLIHEFAAPSGTKYFRIYRKFVYNKKQYGSNQTIRVYGLEVCKAGGGYTNYTVSYADGNTAPASHLTWPSNIAGVPNGKQIVAPAAPTASGYIFGGWYTDSGCTSAWNWGSSTVSKDTTLYAKWTAKTQPTQYTVMIDAATVCSGSSTNIKMTSSQSGVSYQLYKGEDKVGDAKDGGSALTWSSISTTGTYKVMAVENATYAAREMSNTVSLANYDAVSIKTHPTSEIAATVDVGSDMSVELNTGTFNNASYTWQTCTDATPSSASDISSGSQYANYNTATMTFTPAAEGTYYFRCKVTDDCGTTVYSNVATVTASVAKEDPTVYELSGTTSVCEGDEATITLSGSDDGVTYALYLDGVDQSDDKVGDGNAITWTVTADGTYTVSAKADATYNAADMDGSAVISYKTATAIGTQPTAAVSGHDGVDFTLGSDLAATGEGTLTYQWYSYTSAEDAGQATVGSATTTKTLTTSKAAGTYYYKVEVIGECGRVKSDMITVTVDNKHRITYDANNGSGAPSGNWKSPGAMTLPTDLPTRSGYIFLGWNTKDDGTGDMYQPGGSFTMPSSATTLYAAWASPCFSFSKGTKNTEPTDGTVMTPENINSSAFKGGATLSGGTLTNTSGATLGINGTYGFVMIKSTRELTLTLTGGQFREGTVIELEGTTNKASGSKTYGFSISGNALTSLKTVDDSNTAFSQRYVVTASDGVEGEESCTITMNADASGSQTYLSAIKIGGCMACTSINPTLTYSKTTIWMDDESLTASPTLNKDGSTGSVTYVSGNTAVATVNESTGVVTAVARGTATITATIEADGTHCGKTATCVITVKDMECGENVIIEAVRKSGTKTEASHDGILYGSSAINTYDNGKLGGTGNYFGLTLKSGYYFQDGDKLYVKLNTINENGDGIVVTSGLDGSGTVIGTLANASQSTDYSNEITLSNVPASTSSIVIYRTASVTQNPYIDAMKVKRYGCPDVYVFDAADSGLWSDEDNWIGAAGHGSGLPTIEDRAIITKPIAVDIAHATASEVRLDQSSTNAGSLTIQANKGLEVAGKVQVWNGSALSATTPSDLLLESSSAGNATLIFDNSNSDQATVQMYSKGWTTGEQGGGTWNWQTVGVPVTDATRMNDYYGGYMYEWSSSRWVDKTDMYGALTPFTAYSVSYPTGDEEHLHTYSIDGTLVPTGDKSISIPANTSVMALANSWTAPIHISDIEFTSEPANIFLYNTGYNYESAATKADSRYAPGTYLCIPKNSASYLDESYIAPMQGFYVKNKLSSAGTITINYDDVVRPSSDRAIVSGAMHAPKREISHLSEPAVLKMYVSDSQHDDRLVLLEREDFSRGFDNGWDGEKFQINAVKTAPRIFAINETGGKESVSAIPELENTVIGFRPGKEETYTIRFEYNGDETLYLRDTRTDAETLITNESEYVFLSDGTNEDARFIIVRVQSTPTGTEEIGAGSKAYKLMIEDHIYIIRDGRMYSVDGALVK